MRYHSKHYLNRHTMLAQSETNIVLRSGALLNALIFLALPSATFAQDRYPGRPLRMVTAEAGGGGDFIARLIANELTGSLGQQVVVENGGGASGMIAAQTVVKASPDGHTLLFYSGFVWTLPFMKIVPYDPVQDLIPVTLTARAPNILVVNPALPVKSVKELIALAKAKPGELTYASSGSGGTPHLAAELFKSMAGIAIVHVPYKGQAQALSELIGGQIQVMFPNAASVAPHIKPGRVRALAVTTTEPSALAPGLPTVASAGLPGYESVVMFGVFVPAKTPGAIVERLNHGRSGVSAAQICTCESTISMTGLCDGMSGGAQCIPQDIFALLTGCNSIHYTAAWQGNAE